MDKQFFLIRSVYYEEGGNNGYQQLFPSEASCVEAAQELPKIAEKHDDRLLKVEIIQFYLDEAGTVTDLAAKTTFDGVEIHNMSWTKESWRPVNALTEVGPVANRKNFRDPMVKLEWDNPIAEIIVGQPLKYEQDKMTA